MDVGTARTADYIRSASASFPASPGRTQVSQQPSCSSAGYTGLHRELATASKPDLVRPAALQPGMPCSARNQWLYTQLRPKHGHCPALADALHRRLSSRAGLLLLCNANQQLAKAKGRTCRSVFPKRAMPSWASCLCKKMRHAEHEVCDMCRRDSRSFQIVWSQVCTAYRCRARHARRLHHPRARLLHPPRHRCHPRWGKRLPLRGRSGYQQGGQTFLAPSAQ